MEFSKATNQINLHFSFAKAITNVVLHCYNKYSILLIKFTTNNFVFAKYKQIE